MGWRGRLFGKYAGVLAALVGGALVASGGVELYFSYREQEAALAQVQREQAALAATRIERFVREIEQQAAWLLQPGHAVGSVQIGELTRDATRMLGLVPAVEEIEYIDRSGQQQLLVRRRETDRIRSNEDVSQEPRFTEAQERRGSGASWYSPVTFRGGTEPFMTIARAEPGLAAGVVAVEVDLQLIYEVVSAIRVGTSGRAYVVDASGHLIAHPNFDLVLERADLSGLPQVRSAIESSTLTETERAMVAADLAGHQTLTAYEPIPALGWYVFVEQPLSEAFAPLYSSLLRAAALIVAGVAVSVLVGLVLARRMVRPIQALQASAARIGAGALDERIEIHTGDELEELAREFDAMRVRLRDSYATLEGKVEERTRELASALDDNVKLLDEVRDKGRQLEAASRHKSEFLANMSHELRTPLNAIIGFSQVLHDGVAGEMTPKQVEYLGDVIDSAHHLLALINEVLDLSKVEAGRMELNVGRFSIREALEVGVTMTRERASRHGISLSVDVAADVDEVEADERKVKQVILNLLSNAVKFTPDGGSIGLRADRVESELRIAVRDTGVGIAQDDLSKIFEEFRQVGQGPRHEGTGLGLALSKRFVEMHGGRMWVESAVGRGSTFTFTLPLGVPAGVFNGR